MSYIDFGMLSDNTRIWIFGAAEPLTINQKNELRLSLSFFTEKWHAHEKPVTGSFEILHDRFVILAADENYTSLSGCSMDSMIQNLKVFEKSSGVDLINNTEKVFYRDKNNSIKCIDRRTFKKLFQNGKITENTIVFDNTITGFEDYADGNWELPLKDSWQFKLIEDLSAA